MDLADFRVPDPDEVEESFIFLPYISKTHTDNDGYYEHEYALRRYIKLRVGSYTEWVLDGETNA